jgi:hypothetical protein
MLVIHECLLGGNILFFRLFLEVIDELDSSLSFLLPFLLFSNSKFLISEFPKLSELKLFSLLVL